MSCGGRKAPPKHVDHMLGCAVFEIEMNIGRLSGVPLDEGAAQQKCRLGKGRQC